MARRKQLKGIAIDLSRHYGCRSNDFLGYWAIGFLCKEAARDNITTIKLNLLKPTPDRKDIIPRIELSMQAGLKKQLNAHDLPIRWLTEATFEICFTPGPPALTELISPSRFISKLTLVSDLSQFHIAEFQGSCRPHDAQLEIRRRQT